MPDEETKHIFEAGGTEVSTAAGGARRYRKPLKCLRWHDIKFLFGEGFDGWDKHKALRLGASLAFYTLLSLAPLLLMMVAIVGLVFGRVTAQHEVVRQVHMLIGAQGTKAIEALLQASRNTTQGIVATIIRMVTLLFGASGVMIELRDALNTIWEVPTPKLVGVKSRIISYFKERLFSFAMLLSIGFILIVSLAISAWIVALVHSRQVFARTLFGEGEHRFQLRRLRFHCGFGYLGLLFRPNLFLRSGVHKNFRESLWLATQSKSGRHDQGGWRYGALGGNGISNYSPTWDQLRPL